MELRELINNENVTIVDVREIYEFESGHAQGSINIPLGTIMEKIADFKNMSKPILVYCASGNRSGQAASFLTDQGVTEIYNGGGVTTVINLQQKTV